MTRPAETWPGLEVERPRVAATEGLRECGPEHLALSRAVISVALCNAVANSRSNPW